MGNGEIWNWIIVSGVIGKLPLFSMFPKAIGITAFREIYGCLTDETSRLAKDI